MRGCPWGWGCSHATGEAGSAAQPTAWPSPAPTVQPAARACSMASFCEAAKHLPGEGREWAQGKTGLPLRPFPRAQGPKAWEPARAHPFPSLYIRVHLRISACLSSHPAQDLLLLLPRLQLAASLTWGQALPEKPMGVEGGGRPTPCAPP